MRTDRRVCSLLSARIFHDYRQRSQNSTIFFLTLYLCDCDICLLYSTGFGSTYFSHFVWLWVKRIDRKRRTGVLVGKKTEFFLTQQQSKSESRDIKWRWRPSMNYTKKSLCLIKNHECVLTKVWKQVFSIPVLIIMNLFVIIVMNAFRTHDNEEVATTLW